MAVKLNVNIAGMKLKNPLIAASGTCGYGNEGTETFDITKFGAITTKTITLEPRNGNNQPRLLETPSGLLNSIGLQNMGCDAFESDVLPDWEKIKDVALIVSIGGNNLDEYVALCKRLDSNKRIDAFEINISCPNVKSGCLAIGANEALTTDLIKRLKQVTSKPVIIKLSPNIGNIQSFAQAVEKAGADAISLVNTFLGMAVDVSRKALYFERGAAGLSGPAIRPLALKKVYDVVSAVNIPVIGMGGIMNCNDALEFLMIGVQAVIIGTANLVDPNTSTVIHKDLLKYCEKNSISDINEIIGVV